MLPHLRAIRRLVYIVMLLGDLNGKLFRNTCGYLRKPGTKGKASDPSILPSSHESQAQM